MHITRTRHGLRLSQHGVVISELRVTAGPTHSVFDLLAGVMMLRDVAADAGDVTRGRAALLGFAGGGMLAPLQALGFREEIAACDLDQRAHALFRQHCPQWAPFVRWERADALAWLRGQRRRWAMIVDDLSLPRDGDVTKPAICWRDGGLPEAIRARLQADGWAVFNLLPPVPARAWGADVRRLGALFSETRTIALDEYENQILIGGRSLPSAGELARGLRACLDRIGSRQARRFTVRNGGAHA